MTLTSWVRRLICLHADLDCRILVPVQTGASPVPAVVTCAILVVLASCTGAVNGTRPSVSNAGADLVAAAPTTSNGSVSVGAPFTLSVTVRNLGERSSAATAVRYYRSDDTAITPSDTEVGMGEVPELAASGSASRSMVLTAPAAAGTYYYGACVDATPSETNNMNNCSMSVEVTAHDGPGAAQGQSDLMVATVSASDYRPARGARFTLSATVTNGGDGAAGATRLRYYRSADATITTSDASAGAGQVPALDGLRSASTSVELPAPTAPGTYYYGACVDAPPGETDTTNNCSSSIQVRVPATVEAPQGDADLVVTSVSVSDGDPDAGARITVSATVSNVGDGPARPSTVRYFRSVDATITTSDTQVGTDAVVAIAPTGSSSESTELTAPTTPGTYYYGACVDAVVGESDSSNNCSTAALVTVPEPRRPDLTVTATSVSDGSPATGALFTVSATVRNGGDGDADSTTLRYYRSTDATITTADTQVGTDAVAPIAASGSSSESMELTAPTTSGTYYYGACVDAATDESDTTNNCSASVKVGVRAATVPNLQTASTVDLSNPVVGETFTLSATVLNTGRGASAATTLRYYRSTDSTVTTSDTEVGTDTVDALSGLRQSDHSISLTAPSTVGGYYYGACVDAVANESDTTDNCSAAVKVDVQPLGRRVDISPRTLTFNALGGSATVAVRILNENGDEDSEASFFWVSIYGAGGPCCTLTRVDGDLKVTANKNGRMTVDVGSKDARSIRLSVTVSQQQASLEVSPASETLQIGATATLSATVKDANDNAMDDGTIYWATSDAEIATVEGADEGGETGATATVTAVSDGTVTITARTYRVSGTAAVIVTP